MSDLCQRHMPTHRAWLRLVLILGAIVLPAALPAVDVAAGPTNETLILDTGVAPWRTFAAVRSPVVVLSNGMISPLREPPGRTKGWEQCVALPVTTGTQPAEDWMKPDFDDSVWSRSLSPMGPSAPYEETLWTRGGSVRTSLICARGRFAVADPTAVKSLSLSLQYMGGAIVYLNGREIGRGDIPEGSFDASTTASPYPKAAYLWPESAVPPVGGHVVWPPGPKRLDEQSSLQMAAAVHALRTRTLRIEISPRNLRKGVNILAVAVCRAPIQDVFITTPYGGRQNGSERWPGPWPHCRLLRARLAERNGFAVTPNIARPAGVQVWQPQGMDTPSGEEWGNPLESLRPVRLVGCRNGSFSTQFVVGSPAAIRGLKVTASPLAGASGAVISADRVQVRFPDWYDGRLDCLATAAPDPVALREARRTRESPIEKAALQPVWVTVNVPSEAGQGTYAGTVRVEAEGLAPRDVPLSIHVYGWTVPAPRDLVAHNDMWQSHESVAFVYKTPLWSDRHFELMGRALELTAPLANKFCHVPLVCGTFQCGNGESMVRWIPRDDGTFDYDFSLFDRYLDLYDKKIGKPRVLMLDVCVPMFSGARPTDGTNPVKVSQRDPATGKVSPMRQPSYDPPTGVAFWKPVLDEAQRRLEKRGWWDAVVIGTASDSGPTPGEADTFKQIWPEKGWLFSGHPNATWVGKSTAPVRCIEWVWGAGNLWDPSSARGKPYPRPWQQSNRISTAFPRFGCGHCELFQNSPSSEYRSKMEKTMQCNHQGIGRVGIDFWPFLDERGRRIQLTPSGGQFTFNAGVAWFMTPGPDGPLLSTRAQMFREGLQMREAMTWLAQCIDSGKLPVPLAKRAEAVLTDRAASMLDNDPARDHQQAEEALFALCAELSSGASRPSPDAK